MICLFVSNSGETQELKPVIKYANRNKIILIGIVSKKTPYFIELKKQYT